MKLIPANEVTIETLAKIVKDALYVYEVDGNDTLKVIVDQREFFIGLNSKIHRYSFHYITFIKSKHQDIFNILLGLCNQVNIETAYMKATCRKEGDGFLFLFETDIRYDTGFDPHQFMSNFRFFEHISHIRLRFFAEKLIPYT